MARREHQIRKCRGTAHLPQILVTVGRGRAHVIGDQVAGQRNIAGFLLIIAGIEGFQIDGFQRAVGGGFPNKPIGAIRLLLAGAKVKAVAAQNGVNGIRVKAAVAVGGTHKHSIHHIRLGVILPQRHTGIGVQVIHQQKVQQQAERRRDGRKQHKQARLVQRAGNAAGFWGCMGHVASFTFAICRAVCAAALVSIFIWGQRGL